MLGFQSEEHKQSTTKSLKEFPVSCTLEYLRDNEKLKTIFCCSDGSQSNSHSDGDN